MPRDTEGKVVGRSLGVVQRSEHYDRAGLHTAAVKLEL